jgi:predicted permease
MGEQIHHAQVIPNLFGDARVSLRQLSRAPLFTLSAALSLALGIGTGTAVFTVAERALLRPLPVADPQELVFLTTDQRSPEEPSPRFSYPFYASLRANAALNGTAARFGLTLNATVNRQDRRVAGELVSGNYFDVLGAGVQLGRPITADDDRTPGAHPVAVISDRLWRSGFASDPGILARHVHVNGHAFSIVGVATREFTGTDVGFPADVWLPLAMQRQAGRDLFTDGDTNWLEIVGRLKAGDTRERAGSELTAYLAGHPGNVNRRFTRGRLLLVPGDTGRSPVRRELGPALQALAALAALAFVLACVNVASLLAVRSASREKEVAVRLALGARRSRLAQQFLTETLMLAGIGGGAGLLLAPWTARLLIASQPRPLAIDGTLDMRAFTFGLAISALAGVLVAQLPIFGSRSLTLIPGGGSSPPRSPPLRVTAHDVVVTVQIAATLAMLVSAALLAQSLRSLRSVDPGFRGDDLLLVSVDPRSAGYDGARLERFWREAVERIGRIRGVESVSLAGTVPLAPGRQREPWFNATSGEIVEIDTNYVGPAYFRTLEIPLLSGREFSAQDGSASRPVVIVNERLARMFWPDQNPIGRQVRMVRPDEFGARAPIGPPAGPLPEVVGVVKDARHRDLRLEHGPMLYRPQFQTLSRDPMTLHIRAAGEAAALAPAVRHEMQQLERHLPPFGITTLENQLNDAMANTRGAAVLAGFFGVLAMLLSGIGVYSVAALAVSRRTRELGIRIALGARTPEIVDLIGRRGLALVVAGLCLGTLGSLIFTRTAEALLHGVTAGDPVTFAGAAALVATVCFTGFAVPLRAATRLDPVAAIRSES